MTTARRIATGAIAAGLLASTAVALAPTASAVGGTVGVGRYNAITPVRALDTRDAGNSPLGPQEVRTLDLSSAIGTSASAAVINFTAVQPTASGFLTVAPAGTSLQGLQSSSSLNLLANTTRANSVTVAVGSGSKISIYNNVGSTNVIVDVVGWYSSTAGTSTATDYYPLDTPSRLFDTRDPSSFTDPSQARPLDTGDHSTLVVSVDYYSADVNKTIKALAINLTVTDTANLGYLTTWDGSGSLPPTSAINWVAGQTIANTDIVPVRCADAACNTLTFSIRNSVSPSTDVIADIVGQYATPDAGGLVYDPKTPVRITDTRNNDPFTGLGAHVSGVTNVRSTGKIDAEAQAINVNVTAIVPTAISFVAVYPKANDQGGPPLVSTLNVEPGVTAPNGAQVTLAQDGSITSYNNAGALNLAIDLEGQFLPDPQFGA